MGSPYWRSANKTAGRPGTTGFIPDNGQVERMNRTIKEATVQRYHYDRHDQLEAHLADFINAYNYARRLKTLKGLAPYEYICKCWTSQPERFKLNPLQKMPGLNN
jgi:transposase InsO family protein